jgi:two-component system nitrate/nitrite response regulator NarL
MIDRRALRHADAGSARSASPVAAPDKPSLLLCDDHVLLSEALASALGRRGFTDVEIAASPAAALALLRRRRRDVCLLDLAFPDGDGLAAAREIRELQPDIQLVVLSATTDAAVVSAGFPAGIVGFCRKDMRVDAIIRAIEHVHSGHVFVDPSLLRNAVATTTPTKGDDGVRLLTRYLTQRELEVLALLSAGESTTGIAMALGVTRSTARTHVQSVLTKLGVHSRLEAVAVAARAGLRLPAV